MAFRERSGGCVLYHSDKDAKKRSKKCVWMEEGVPMAEMAVQAKTLRETYANRAICRRLFFMFSSAAACCYTAVDSIHGASVYCSNQKKVVCVAEFLCTPT